MKIPTSRICTNLNLMAQGIEFSECFGFFQSTEYDESFSETVEQSLAEGAKYGDRAESLSSGMLLKAVPM